DLVLKRGHLFLQFVLCRLQCTILRLDLRQHLVKRVSQPPHLVTADFGSPHGIIVMLGDGSRCPSKAQNRIGDEPKKLTRKQEREKEGSGNNQRENAAVDLEKVRWRCA